MFAVFTNSTDTLSVAGRYRGVSTFEVEHEGSIVKYKGVWT